jgi:hypothetical protein
MPMKTRRTFLAVGAALPALAAPAAAQQPQTRRFFRQPPQPPPPYSAELAYGNLVFISGKGVGVGFKGGAGHDVRRHRPAAWPGA